MFHDEETLEVLKRILHALERLHSIERTLHRIERELFRLNPNRTTQLKISFGGNMAATLPGSEIVGQSVIATAVAFEADGLTPTPGAVVSAQVWSISDATIASMVQNADGTATFTALAAGTATVIVSGTVTDSDGVTGIFSGSNTLTVTVPTGRTAGLQIAFGVPTP